MIRYVNKFLNILFGRIMKADPNHQACLPIYITCLVAMKNSQSILDPWSPRSIF